jgi:hypothetical protein
MLIRCILVLARGESANSRRGRQLSPCFLTTAHTYPFVLSLGIVVQGIIFAVIQSRGLNGLLLLGCIPLSQAMMPGMYPLLSMG